MSFKGCMDLMIPDRGQGVKVGFSGRLLNNNRAGEMRESHFLQSGLVVVTVFDENKPLEKEKQTWLIPTM